MKKKYALLNLFPFFVKKVAIGIIALLILLFILIMAIPELYFLKEYKAIYKIIFITLLLIISLSKSRVEDEMSIQNRLVAFTAGFVFGVVMLICDELFNTAEIMSASQLIIRMFMFHFMMLFILNHSFNKS